jgi:hypothetical protein
MVTAGGGGGTSGGLAETRRHTAVRAYGLEARRQSVVCCGRDVIPHACAENIC